MHHGSLITCLLKKVTFNLNDCIRRFNMLRYFQNVLPDFDNEFMVEPSIKLTESIEEIINTIKKKFVANDKNAHDGLYLGTAGVAYMFYHVSKVPALQSFKQQFLTSAIEYIQPALVLTAQTDNVLKNLPSLLLGNGGIYAVASVIFHANKDVTNAALYRNKYIQIAPICKSSFLKCGDDELFVGKIFHIRYTNNYSCSYIYKNCPKNFN